MHNNIGPQDIVTWFRTQAKTFNDMANQVEQTFKAAPLGGHNSSMKPVQTEKTITPEQVRTFVSVKNQRVTKIASHFGCSEKQIHKIIEDPDNRLHIAERGWVKQI